MGNTTSIKKIGFEDMKYVIKNKKKNYVMINTLAITEQECLIPGTISVNDEEAFINRHLNKNISIVIYDSKGEFIRDVYNGELSPGQFEFIWNGINGKNLKVTSGVYFCKIIQNGQFISSRKMILLK